jgi:hypothetical protein
MQIDDSIFGRLEQIDWFSKCAEPHGEIFSFDVAWVNDWPTATKIFSDPEWENTTLEARNALTVFLAKKHAREYQEWNKITKFAKEKLEPTVFEKVRQFQAAKGLNKVFVDCVKWDVLGIVMEQTYKVFRPPIFFEKLQTVYENGRFPCGWKGEWPNGHLIVI